MRNEMVNLLGGTLEEAKRKVAEEFTFFGLTERYAEFVQMCEFVFGWPILKIRKDNVNPDPTRAIHIHEPVIDRIRSLNSLDFELHQFVVDLYPKQLERYPKVREFTKPRTRDAC